MIGSSVGTRFFKEFSVDGRRVETRMVSRIGEGPRDFAFMSYLWNEDETEAEKVGPEGFEMLWEPIAIFLFKAMLAVSWLVSNGWRTSFSRSGFSAIQLSHDGEGVTLNQLMQDERLSHVPTSTSPFLEMNKRNMRLGILHARGSCHNQSTDGLPQFDMDLWLSVEHASVEETGAWKTAVG